MIIETSAITIDLTCPYCGTENSLYPCCYDLRKIINETITVTINDVMINKENDETNRKDDEIEDRKHINKG